MLWKLTGSVRVRGYIDFRIYCGIIMPTLLSVSEALKILLSNFQPVGTEQIDIKQAAGRVLAEDICAGFDLPPFSSSGMDGFALRSSDVGAASRENPVCLTVIADIPAGHLFSGELAPGQAARIMTGAPLPAGADAVVPLEETDAANQQAGSHAPAQVVVYRPAQVGDFIRKQGRDARADELLIPSGTRMRPQEVGLLAMLGLPQPEVYRRPRLAILPTGDELIRVGDPLVPGKIYESNTYALSAQVDQAGGEAISLGLVADDLEAVKEALDRAVEAKVDLILASAGVSVGAYDYVRTAVEQGGKISFWRVNIRPGKPFAFGFYHEVPFIGLPGNPVSAFISFEVFVRAAVLKMAGQTDWKRTVISVVLMDEVNSDGRESFLRAVVSFRDGRAYAQLTGNQDSGNLRSLIQANALLIIPNEVKCLPIGTEVQAWLV
jgi:molybdopterin molybdotransferase